METPLYNYKTLATRARAATSKLNNFRGAYSNYSPSPKSVDVSKYNNLMSTPSNEKATIPYTTGSFAKEGQWLKGLGKVTVPYGGTTKYSGTGNHKAVDIGNKPGTPVHSFTPGTVVDISVGNVHGKGYGNYVIVKDKYGGVHRYSQLDNVYKTIQPGTQIGKGEYLGGMGDTGATYGSTITDPKTGKSYIGTHLHYDVKYNNQYIDPFAYLVTNFYNKQQYG